VQARHPDVVFLAEAFTQPKPMAKLAEIGFSQSYTYFTWRTTRDEFVEYLEEVALGPKADYMRPNFWPNTPDILSGPLRNGGPGVFRQRLVLAATMSPSYGIYSGYELCENEPFSDVNEEYLHSEKYEIKHRDFGADNSIADFVTLVNGIRRRHPALRELDNITFHHSNNEWILAYSKQTGDDTVLTVVNLDPYGTHDDTLWLDLEALGFEPDEPFEAHDELTGTTYVWHGPTPYVRLEPDLPAHVLHLRPLA
jgi:starch synthase (maltosyl-transferring)